MVFRDPTFRDLSQLYRSPNALSPHYARFRVGDRLLLTGHSHQAWPDRAAVGQARAWDDAAELVDAKWARALEQGERVREGFARLLDGSKETLSLGPSTHALVVAWLSALPLRARPRIVTTDSEFHSVRRQLGRLAEEGLVIVRVAARPVASLAERLAAAVDDRTAATIVSTVLYKSGEIVENLAAVARACEKHGAALLLDAYHQLNVVPFSLRAQGLESAFVTGGGYKYCQLGEGNAFLRAPQGCALRPVVTGWFAEFDELSGPGGGVGYGPLAVRFAGATYDPTSHYRAAEVFAFFAEQGLTADVLREVSQHQVGLLRAEVDALGLPPSVLTRADVPIASLAGFLALQSPRAADLQRELAARGVLTDCRGDVLRLGPAPYLSDDQLRSAVAILGEVARASP
jgi:kynureninase